MSNVFKSIVFIIGYCFLQSAYANAHVQDSYRRNYWFPTYENARLNYCLSGQKSCGFGVANLYCQSVGYKQADKAVIDYNVGRTNLFGSKERCHGWQCNGFMVIRCVGHIMHRPNKMYMYSLRKFAVPRWAHYRVSWCYKDHSGCGQRAAFSFCRRMGYTKAQSFKAEANIQATKALGNQKLCLGPKCRAFSEIVCSR